ncbi:MAG: FKBP-type peptidyl-prolyl cis-trans isomerase [Verrucomicrobia bacterium]|nr:FKBP-type peptidyl-prolyl cis-trans isomerase [Verrucomicrobiota bacterium]
MKKQLLLIGILGLALWPARAEDKTELKDQKEKLSYSIGMNLGNNLRTQEVDVDRDILFQGVRDALANKTILSEADARQTISTWQREARAKQEERRKTQGEKNKTEGENFLAENKSKPGVITLPSGLQYKVLSEGKGNSPKASDQVSVHYRGTLIDGTEFDNSYKRGQPATFGVTGVIRGWTEALQLMRPGDKWQLFIPSDLAYAERGKGAQIAPNATLIFEVELLSFEHSEPAAAATVGGPPPPNPPTPKAANQPVTSDIIKVPSAEELKKGAKIEIIKADELEKLQKEAQKEKEKK